MSLLNPIYYWSNVSTDSIELSLNAVQEILINLEICFFIKSLLLHLEIFIILYLDPLKPVDLLLPWVFVASVFVAIYFWDSTLHFYIDSAWSLFEYFCWPISHIFLPNFYRLLLFPKTK